MALQAKGIELDSHRSVVRLSVTASPNRRTHVQISLNMEQLGLKPGTRLRLQFKLTFELESKSGSLSLVPGLKPKSDTRCN